MMDPVRALDSIYKIVSAFYDAGYLYSAREKEKEMKVERSKEWWLNSARREEEANVVKLNPGNGAREALIRIMPDMPKVEVPDPLRADMILASLWCEGFKIVPLDPKDEEQ